MCIEHRKVLISCFTAFIHYPGGNDGVGNVTTFPCYYLSFPIHLFFFSPAAALSRRDMHVHVLTMHRDGLGVLLGVLANLREVEAGIPKYAELGELR